jgi:hypothetical protein
MTAPPSYRPRSACCSPSAPTTSACSSVPGSRHSPRALVQPPVRQTRVLGLDVRCWAVQADIPIPPILRGPAAEVRFVAAAEGAAGPQGPHADEIRVLFPRSVRAYEMEQAGSPIQDRQSYTRSPAPSHSGGAPGHPGRLRGGRISRSRPVCCRGFACVA